MTDLNWLEIATQTQTRTRPGGANACDAVAMALRRYDCPDLAVALEHRVRFHEDKYPDVPRVGDGQDYAVHLVQELMDAAQYAWIVSQERESADWQHVYAEITALLILVADLIEDEHE